MRLGSSGPDCSTQENRDQIPQLYRWTWEEAGWHVRGKLSAESAETVDKSLPPAQQKNLQSLSHGTQVGGREEAPPVWMMYGVDPSLRLGF